MGPTPAAGSRRCRTTWPGEGPPLHTHDVQDEAWYVVSGHLRFRIGDELHDAPAGVVGVRSPRHGALRSRTSGQTSPESM